MSAKALQGSIVPMITPFKNGKVDERALAELISATANLLPDRAAELYNLAAAGK